MKKLLLFAFLLLIALSAKSQKTAVKIMKTKNAGVFSWQILDNDYHLVFSDNDFYRSDSTTFWLEANTHYILSISLSSVFNVDTSLCSLSLIDEPIMLVNSDIEPGDHFYPFYTGIKSQQTKITGGTNAAISDFPWQVYFISGNYMCGGTIIGENWILTAAHCTEDDNGVPISPALMTVKAGATNPYNSLEGKTYTISQAIIHEGYNSTTLENDIALLKVSEPINVANAASIRLINSDDVAEGATVPGVLSWVTGWGLTRVRPEAFPTTLQKVQLPIISNTQASTVWSSIPVSDVMAGYLNGNKDACNGDSGGPLVVPVSDGYKIAGIVSWGSSNCNTYGAYTRVSMFENWIRAKTGIAREYKPPVPAGDTLICQGVVSTKYSVNPIVGATTYEWSLLPLTAGTISGTNSNATVIWNTGYTGSANVKLRVTVSGKVSEWSKNNLSIVKNTKVLSQSADTAICAINPVTLNVVAEGNKLDFKWYNGSSLIQSGSSGSLIISSARTNDSGIYNCAISGSCGVLLSDEIELTVHPLTNITYFTPDSEVSLAGEITLEVRSEGHNLTYQWQKDNVLLENGTTADLELTNVNANDIGRYFTTVTGTCGTEISDTTYLFVKRKDSDTPDVYLWPTLSNNYFNVAPANEDVYSIRIIGLSGQLVRDINSCQYQTTVYINTLPKGVYIIKVYNSTMQKTFRFIKE